jgi:fructose-1,6-bisphosphatase
MVMKFNYEIRVLYEVFPMSYLMEQAGGQAFTGKQRVLLFFFALMDYIFT